MQASIVIASHNEGSRLWRTVASCVETTASLQPELLVVDDASTDGSVEELIHRFPQVRVLRHKLQEGVSRTKDDAMRAAQGDVIVLLDGHTKPEDGAIERLVRGVEANDGNAMLTPCVPALDSESWRPIHERLGFGFRMEFESFHCVWVGLQDLTPRGAYFENPSLVGCCLAIGRRLYERLRGFDRDMIQWGQEDIDFALKAWTMGHAILCEPRAIISHRFRNRFDNYPVSPTNVLLNTMRLARKNFTEPVWQEWLEKYRRLRPDDDWTSAWRLFEERRASVEEERAYLHANRVHDEMWYAEKFGLAWPRR